MNGSVDQVPGKDGPEPRSVLWFMQIGQRPWRELHWLSLMPQTRVTAIGSPPPPERVEHVPSRYRQPTKRFIEAGAMAWLRDLDDAPVDSDWVASLEPFSLVTGQAAKFARRRQNRLAVLMWHNFAGSPLYRLPGYRRAWTLSRGQADFFLCLIEASRTHILEMGIEPERVDMVYPGVDTVTFHPPGTPANEPVIGFISPLRASKGLDTVLAAFALLRRTVPGARLVIAGSGEDEPIARAAAAAEPGRVRFLGALPQREVADLMRRLAVFVTAPRPTRTWNEQFGLVYVEAMASGLPVVTTASGTNHEAVPDPNRRVADDPEAIAEALIGFLCDDGLRSKVSALNRSYAVDNHDVVTQAWRMGQAFARAERRLGMR
jgi:glycosyltransferase involved in cell wall biosynthesis